MRDVSRSSVLKVRRSQPSSSQKVTSSQSSLRPRLRRLQILRAEAKKEATIKEAEGQAQAILAVQQANADGIRALNESMPTNQVITLKSLEAFTKAADGKATKIIIPSEIQGIAGLTSSIVEVAKSTEAAAISKQ